MRTLATELCDTMMDLGLAVADLMVFAAPTDDQRSETADREALKRAVQALDRASSSAHEVLRLYDNPPLSRGVRETAA